MRYSLPRIYRIVDRMDPPAGSRVKIKPGFVRCRVYWLKTWKHHKGEKTCFGTIIRYGDYSIIDVPQRDWDLYANKADRFGAQSERTLY